jgi:hypothetical protein
MTDTLDRSEGQAVLEQAEVRALLGGVRGVRVAEGAVEVTDEAALRAEGIDALIHAAVFGDTPTCATPRAG